ncbi:hypothetical protein E2542_SST20265 [Spatholobus suberectus]|nr:hypothetical protein E2542_SST20265 [Spatholobus suberectus]
MRRNVETSLRRDSSTRRTAGFAARWRNVDRRRCGGGSQICGDGGSASWSTHVDRCGGRGSSESGATVTVRCGVTVTAISGIVQVLGSKSVFLKIVLKLLIFYYFILRMHEYCHEF